MNAIQFSILLANFITFICIYKLFKINKKYKENNIEAQLKVLYDRLYYHIHSMKKKFDSIKKPRTVKMKKPDGALKDVDVRKAVKTIIAKHTIKKTIPMIDGKKVTIREFARVNNVCRYKCSELMKKGIPLDEIPKMINKPYRDYNK